MSTSVLLSPAPGWYPDPAAQAAYRWWDGDTWTAGIELRPGDVVMGEGVTMELALGELEAGMGLGKWEG